MDLEPPLADYEILYDSVGKGYGLLTDSGIEAIRLVARTEWLLLDPVYTAKAMASSA